MNFGSLHRYAALVHLRVQCMLCVHVAVGYLGRSSAGTVVWLVFSTARGRVLTAAILSLS